MTTTPPTANAAPVVPTTTRQIQLLRWLSGPADQPIADESKESIAAMLEERDGLRAALVAVDSGQGETPDG